MPHTSDSAQAATARPCRICFALLAGARRHGSDGGNGCGAGRVPPRRGRCRSLAAPRHGRPSRRGRPRPIGLRAARRAGWRTARRWSACRRRQSRRQHSTTLCASTLRPIVRWGSHSHVQPPPDRSCRRQLSPRAVTLKAALPRGCLGPSSCAGCGTSMLCAARAAAGACDRSPSSGPSPRRSATCGRQGTATSELAPSASRHPEVHSLSLQAQTGTFELILA